MKNQTAVKKPIPVPYKQWTGDNVDEIIEFSGVNAYIEDKRRPKYLTVPSVGTLDIYDYVLQDVKGGFYHCPKDVFESTYVVGGGWVNTLDVEPTSTESMYWVRIGDKVEMCYLNDYKTFGGRQNFWQTLRSDDVDMFDTMYMEIKRPENK